MEKKNILLVDDDYIFSYVNQIMLEKTENVENVSIALNGKEAIDLLQQCRMAVQPVPDLIFLDLDMPVMNGFDFLHAFHQMDLPDKEKIELIVITSSQNSEDIERATRLGAKKCFAKPMSENDFKAVLSE